MKRLFIANLFGMQAQNKYQAATYSMTKDSKDVIEQLAKYLAMQKSGVIRFAVFSLARQYGLIT